MNYIYKYPESVFLYISILFVCLVFAYLGSSKKNRKKKFNIWVLLIILILSIFAGIRGETVGFDVAHYIVRHIEPIREGLFSRVNQPVGFKILIWLVYRFTDQTYMVFMVLAFITNGLIISRLWDFRNKASFPMMIFFYYCYYYLITFNVFRQFITIAIVFFVTRFLESKQYFKYCIGIAIAMSIHSIAILGLVLLPIDILLANSDKKQRKIRKVFLIASPALILGISVLLYTYFDYDHYLNLYSIYATGRLGFMTPAKIVISILMFWVLRHDGNIKYNITMDTDELKSIFITYFIGLAMALLVILSSFADRFAWYFLIWEPVFMALKIKKKDLRILMHGIYILFALYTLYLSLNSSGQGIMPYVTKWQ